MINYTKLYISGKGRIVDAYAVDFEALASSGKIAVDVENTGDISAQFSVRHIIYNVQ